MKAEDQSAEREALPPLPAPAYGWTNDYYDGWHYDEFPQERWHELQLYTEEQMHAYARAALSAREAPAQTAAGEQVVQQTIIAHGLTVPAGMPLLKLVERLGEAIAENADLRAAAPARDAVASSDWIMQGIASELYPCKPDIFAATYEAADADLAPPAAKAVEMDAQDAARYRWLREKTSERRVSYYSDGPLWSVSQEHSGYDHCYSGERLDAAIDAAMSAQGGNHG